jgi:hypothetical protein
MLLLRYITLVDLKLNFLQGFRYHTFFQPIWPVDIIISLAKFSTRDRRYDFKIFSPKNRQKIGVFDSKQSFLISS